MKKTLKLFATLFSASFLFVSAAFAEQVISASDLPDGFAGTAAILEKINTKTPVTVSNKKDLLNAVKKGGLIFVDGMIDMSEGMMPKEAGGSSPALDSFVKSHSNFATYREYRDAYVAACSNETEDTSKGGSKQSKLYETMHGMNGVYGSIIRLILQSNTMIIGLTEESGFFGGSVSVKNVSNVILRNLTIRDAYDPFPHHEANDGYNAENDTIVVDGSKNVWIDHCTLGDTVAVSHVMTGGKFDEKWQTYDGLCDIKSTSDNVTVSYCKLMNHDKTMLIGASDSENMTPENRKVTLHHNYFYNCGQRLPMVRLTTVHTYNNFFEVDKTAPYKSKYALGVRFNALIQSENNFYGAGTSYSFDGASGSKQGTVYFVGDIDKSNNGKNAGKFKTSTSPLFKIPYKYEAIPADKVPDFVKANAGAGKASVKK